MQIHSRPGIKPWVEAVFQHRSPHLRRGRQDLRVLDREKLLQFPDRRPLALSRIRHERSHDG